MNVDYLSELFVDDPIQITTHLLDVDHKRIHYFHQMFHETTGKLVATNECLCMNIDLESRRSIAFPESIQAQIDAVLNEHRQVPRPPKVGRKLEIRKR